MKKVVITGINTNMFNPFCAEEEELIANALSDEGLIDSNTKINNIPAAEFCKLFSTKRNAYNKSTRLGNLLVTNSIITNPQLQDALEFQQKNSEQKIGSILIRLGFCTTDTINNVLTTQNQIRQDMEELDLLVEKITAIKKKLSNYFNVE